MIPAPKILPLVPDHLQHAPEEDQIRINTYGQFCRVRQHRNFSRTLWWLNTYRNFYVSINREVTSEEIMRESWLVGHYFQELNPFLPKVTERILYQYPPDQEVREALFFEQDLIEGPSMLVLSSIRTIAERAVIMSPSAEALLHASIVPARAAIIPPDYYPTDPSDAPGPSPLVTCFGCQGTGGDTHGGTCRTCGGTGSVKRRDRQDTPAFPSYSPFPSRYQVKVNGMPGSFEDIKIVASEAVPKDEFWLVDANANGNRTIGVDPGIEGSDRSVIVYGSLCAGEWHTLESFDLGKLIEIFSPTNDDL